MKLLWVLKQMRENAEESKKLVFIFYFLLLFKNTKTNKQKPIILF